MFTDIYTSEKLTSMAKSLFKTERSKNRLDGWFLATEMGCELEKKYASYG